MCVGASSAPGWSELKLAEPHDERTLSRCRVNINHQITNISNIVPSSFGKQRQDVWRLE
jgi:hypothetical protein